MRKCCSRLQPRHGRTRRGTEPQHRLSTSDGGRNLTPRYRQGYRSTAVSTTTAVCTASETLAHRPDKRAGVQRNCDTQKRGSCVPYRDTDGVTTRDGSSNSTNKAGSSTAPTPRLCRSSGPTWTSMLSVGRGLCSGRSLKESATWRISSEDRP